MSELGVKLQLLHTSGIVGIDTFLDEVRKNSKALVLSESGELSSLPFQ